VLDPFTCKLCHALFYECVLTVPCRHKFCKGCIARFLDCPACGADVESTEDDAPTQRLVNAFLLAHSHEHSIEDGLISEEMMTRTDSSVQPVHNSKDHVLHRKAVFHLQMALRALSYGNFESARARANAAKALLSEAVSLLKTDGQSNAPVGQSDTADAWRARLQYELGIVLGKSGDIAVRQGSPAEAGAFYVESIAHLKESTMGAPEGERVKAVSVSLNKLGDLLYAYGQLPPALESYAEALEIRRTARKLGGKDEQIIDLSISLGKVGDIHAKLGDQSLARDEFHEALEGLSALSVNGGNDVQTSDKVKGYMKFFQDRLAELGEEEGEVMTN